ncbi:MAG: molybdate ABC transporter substrate-binding protein [Anaerovorax sp.]
MKKSRFNKITIILALLLLVIGSTFSGCASDKEPAPEAKAPVEVYVSAAASLTEALTEIQTEYAKDCKDTLVFNFGGSGALVKQIQEGAPCDLFLSASKSNMDDLETAGLIDKATRKDLLGNTLTLIASAEKKDVIKDETYFTKEDVKSIAVGTPESVPAGKYAQETFESMGIWADVQGKLVMAKDVKQVLEYVDTGNVDCGLVYKSDALGMKTGAIVCDMPEDSHSPILYPGAVTTEAAQPEAAAAFYDFLSTDYAKSVFEKYGFKVL